MSLCLGKIRNFNTLHKFYYPLKNGNHNLHRELSLISGSITTDRKHGLFNLKLKCSTELPSRNFYKHQVEVNKRIQWKRPVKVPSILPEKSGDLSGLPETNLDEPPQLFKESAEYQSAPDLVKRVLSIKFQPTAVAKARKIESVTEKVKRHQLDNNSVEVKIAKWTAIIRNMQLHVARIPRDKCAKADLKEIIEFRKKRMKLLRSLDYRRFEWLLESLDLLYKPAPSSHERVERKKSMRWLAADYIQNVKQRKMDEYKNVLESQKTSFLQSKLSSMKAIVEEEKAYGVEPSFRVEEIQEAEEALRQRILEEEKTSVGKEEIKEVY